MQVPLTFHSGGEQLAADFFYRDHPGPSPAMVTAAGFGGVKEMLLPNFARSLADAGIACLVFDYPNFGSSTGTPRQHVDLAAQLQAFSDALDVLEADPKVDSTRLGVWGPSLAGGHTLAVAARDARIKTALAIVPFIDVRTRPPLPLLKAVAGDLTGRFFGRARTTVAIAGAPGTAAAMTSDRAEEWITQMAAQAPTYANRVTTASLLEMARHSNRRAAGQVPVPTRVILAEDDTITPARRVRRAVEKNPHIDVVSHPGTHFELLDDNLDHTIRETTEWFTATLRPQLRTGATR